MSAQNTGKQAAARAALEFVIEGKVLGVGTGSTVNFLIDELAAQRTANRRRGLELQRNDGEIEGRRHPGARPERRR